LPKITIHTETQIHTLTNVDVFVIIIAKKNLPCHNGMWFWLHRMKGSDASWEDNNEPPPKCLDYSDDEEERAARRSLQAGERKVMRKCLSA
jgi:hypothetical protein